METPSVYGGSEDDRVRERDIISVIGSPNGSERVNGSMSQPMALPVARSRAKQIDWYLAGMWKDISEEEALKKGGWNCYYRF